ncbi:MAG: N-methyl-L-tryptophan oxidase [Acidobacteriota bacterium]
MSATVDLLVLGGGAVGASVAWAAARGSNDRLPISTALLDAGEPAHPAGSSHGDGRIWRISYSEDVYVDLARRAEPLWQELATTTGQSLWIPTGGLDLGPASSPIVAELLATFDRLDIEHRVHERASLRRHLPQIETPPGSVGVYQPSAAVVRADRAVRSLWQAAEAAGARRFSGRAMGLESDDSGIQLRLADGRSVAARRLVVAAGSWSGAFASRALGLDLPLRVSEEVVAYFPPSARARTGHHAGTLPVVIDYHEALPFYALPQIDVAGVKVGWHRSGPILPPEQLHREAEDGLPAAGGEPDAAVLERVRRYVGDRFPYLEMTPIVTTTCRYTMTPDLHFLIDRWADDPRVTLAAGFSGHGFKFAPALGEAIVDLALGAEPRIDLTSFRIARFADLDRLQPRLTA